MGKITGSLPNYSMALFDVAIATPRERRRARAEAYRVHMTHGAGAMMWLNMVARHPGLPRSERRVLCLAYWYLSMVGPPPPEHWRDLA